MWEDGELVDEPTDVRAHWRDDLVSFLIGCSFTFEWALSEAGVPMRHIEQGRNVPMYVTESPVPSRGAAARTHGGVHAPGAAASTWRPRSGRAVCCPAVHGSPVHCGDPSGLGIDDLGRPDFGDPVDAEPDDIPVFWACGVTPQAAVMASRPPFAITHAPGQMFLTDARDEQYRVA